MLQREGGAVAAFLLQQQAAVTDKGLYSKSFEGEVYLVEKMSTQSQL